MPTLAVSVVRSPLPNPFETKRNFGDQTGLTGVCNGILAEGEELPSNVLWAKWLISAIVDDRSLVTWAASCDPASA